MAVVVEMMKKKKKKAIQADAQTLISLVICLLVMFPVCVLLSQGWRWLFTSFESRNEMEWETKRNFPLVLTTYYAIVKTIQTEHKTRS